MTTLFIDKQLFNHRTDVRLFMSHPEFADNSWSFLTKKKSSVHVAFYHQKQKTFIPKSALENLFRL